MKMIIEFNEDEMMSALADQFLMDLIYKIRRVSAKHMNEQNITITEKVKPIAKDLKEKGHAPVVKRKYTRRADKDSPVPKIHKHLTPNRDKICEYCMKPFRDDSKTNTRKWCSDECKVSAKLKEATFRVDKGQPADVHALSDGPAPAETSYYKKKIAEQQAAKAEAEMLDELKFKSKIDWDKAHKLKSIPDSISL